MFHNRIGISVDEECFLSWIVSELANARHQDKVRSADMAYLAASKYPTAAPVRFDVGVEATPKIRLDGQATLLRPTPAALDVSLAQVLSQRVSERGDFGNAITLEQLSNLLGYAVGYRSRGSRAYPSPGGLFATDIYVHARCVGGLDDGLYLLDPSRGTLIKQRSGLTDAALIRLSPYLAGKVSTRGQAVSLPTVPAIIYLVSDLTRLKPKYQERALRLALLEAGGLLQNLALCATALGLKHLQVSGYIDDVLSAGLHLDEPNQFVTSLLPVGVR